MESTYKEVKELLKKYDQEHLLHFYNELSETEKESLIKKLSKIDYENVQEIYKNINKLDEEVEYSPIKVTDKQRLTKEEIANLSDARKRYC